MADIQPMHQFMVQKVVDLPPIHIGAMSLDLSITNSVLYMLIAAGLITVFFLTASRGAVG